MYVILKSLLNCTENFAFQKRHWNCIQMLLVQEYDGVWCEWKSFIKNDETGLKSMANLRECYWNLHQNTALELTDGTDGMPFTTAVLPSKYVPYRRQTLAVPSETVAAGAPCPSELDISAISFPLVW